MNKKLHETDIINRRFNRVTVTKILGRSGGHIHVECSCICGKIFEALYNNVRKGNTKSCGCLAKERPMKYFPKTGRFLIDNRPSRCISKNGYQTIGYRGKHVYAHRLAWKMFYGEFPPDGLDIDHINRDRQDNRICNLRVVNRSENLKNREPAKNSFSGHEDRALDMYLSGKTCTEIAEQLKTDRHYVANHLKTLGVKIKRGFAATRQKKE